MRNKKNKENSKFMIYKQLNMETVSWLFPCQIN
uniref:Uncharacterized protein n=1 Tax=Anguilla anguilla TaxID=7936 RepID=A0A0E9U8Q5_ANGAN